jgi:hypothetical protein
MKLLRLKKGMYKDTGITSQKATVILNVYANQNKKIEKIMERTRNNNRFIY